MHKFLILDLKAITFFVIRCKGTWNKCKVQFNILLKTLYNILNKNEYVEKYQSSSRFIARNCCYNIKISFFFSPFSSHYIQKLMIF